MNAKIDKTGKTGGASKLRALAADDLESVIELDKRISGRSRRGFFEKRLQAALADPDGFIVVATAAGKTVTGFAIARLQAGEFGDAAPVATLDAIGVDPEHQGRGLGRMLVEGLEARMRKRDVHELRTMTEWSDHDLVRFFGTLGFALAPRQVLERPCTSDRDL